MCNKHNFLKYDFFFLYLCFLVTTQIHWYCYVFKGKKLFLYLYILLQDNISTVWEEMSKSSHKKNNNVKN